MIGFSLCEQYMYLFKDFFNSCRHNVLLLDLESVSCTPDGLYILGVAGADLNFLTDFLNMHCNRSNVSDEVGIPDFAEQLFLGTMSSINASPLRFAASKRVISTMP